MRLRCVVAHSYRLDAFVKPNLTCAGHAHTCAYRFDPTFASNPFCISDDLSGRRFVRHSLQINLSISSGLPIVLLFVACTVHRSLRCSISISAIRASESPPRTGMKSPHCPRPSPHCSPFGPRRPGFGFTAHAVLSQFVTALDHSLTLAAASRRGQAYLHTGTIETRC